jgi:hypothetical protein
VQSYNARCGSKFPTALATTPKKPAPVHFPLLTFRPCHRWSSREYQYGIDAVITWQPVTQNIYHSPLTPDGYIVLYNETPYEDDQYYYFLGRSYTTTYTHQDVAEFRDQMFYKVLAYKNYRGDVDNIIQAALANPDAKISLAELKAALRSYTVGGDK